jgi:hypothetical protein
MLCLEATAANGYLAYLISWYLDRRYLGKLLAIADLWSFLSRKKCEELEFNRPTQIFIKLVIIASIWNVLQKSHLLKAWSLAQCSHVEIGEVLGTWGLFLPQRLNALINSHFDQIIGKRGKIWGQGLVGGSWSWEILFSASPCWNPFLGFSLLPHCHVVAICALSCTVHHDILPPTRLQQWSQLITHSPKPMKQNTFLLPYIVFLGIFFTQMKKWLKPLFFIIL